MRLFRTGLLACAVGLAGASAILTAPARADVLNIWNDLRNNPKKDDPTREAANRLYEQRVAELTKLEAAKMAEALAKAFKNYPADAIVDKAKQRMDPFGFSLRMANYGADVEPGEPTQGGVMNKTLWNWVGAGSARRIVVHTFDTEIDTALAVYSGFTFPKLKKVAFNDDFSVAGVSSRQSLVQFDAKKNEDYSIQIGSKTGEEDDLTVTARIFPPEGGLSAFLARAGNSPVYDNPFTFDFAPRFFPPTFVLHNSMDKSMEVTSSSDLGKGVVAPAPITLAPGEAKPVTFSITDEFEDSAARIVSGNFTFTGRAQGKVVSIAQHPALIVISPYPRTPEALKVEIDAQVRPAFIGASAIFEATITNVSSSPVKGCYATADIYERMSVSWRRDDPKTKRFIGDVNEPFDLAPGESKSMGIEVETHDVFSADPTSANLVQIGCASTGPAVLDKSNQFAVTSRFSSDPADMIATAFEPKDILDVPASGNGAFRVATFNAGTKAKLTARAIYASPYDDAANTAFSTTVCETDKAGTCLKPAKSDVDFDAEPNKLKWFKVFVKAPSNDPGSDPARRRIFLNFGQPIGDGYSGSQLVGTTSIAVKK